MSISVTCPQCEKSLQVSEEHSGKLAKCPGCGNTIQIPALQQSTQEPNNAMSSPTHPQDAFIPDAPPVTPVGSYPQPAQYASQPNSNVGFHCPYCNSSMPPMVQSQISSAGWAVFVILLLFCLPLFWIGLLIKEEYRVCSSCGMKLG